MSGFLSKINKEWALLLCIVIAAFAARMATFSYPLLVFDPHHHFAIGKFISEGNVFPEVWELSNYPNGAVISEPSGLYYVSVALYWILKPLGATYLTAFKLSAPIFGVLTVIAVYLLAKELFNEKLALYSAIILAFLPAFMYRTFSGFYRGDSFSVFFMVMGFYLFLKSVKGDDKGGILFAILAGICLGMMGLVWNGFLFGFIVISAFVIANSIGAYLKGSYARRMILSYVISAGIGAAIIKYSIMLQPRVENYIVDLLKYILPLTIALLIIFEALKYIAGALPLKKKVVILGVLLLGGGIIAVQYLSEVLQNLITGYGMVKATGDVMLTVSELKPPSNEALWDKYGIAGLIAIPGTLYLMKGKLPEQRMFMIIWLLASVFVMKTALRYTFIASLPIAIVGALFLQRIELKFPRKEFKIVTTTALIFIIMSGAVFSTQQGPHITGMWEDALNFLNSKEEGGVFTWWDYGSWIQGITGFPTTLDTVAGQRPGKMKTVGNILLEKNESKAMEGLKRLKVDYVVISSDMIGQMTNINLILGNEKNYQYTLYIRTGNELLNNMQADKYGSNLFVFNIGNLRIVAIKEDGNLYAFKRVYWREDGKLFKREYQNFSLPTIDRAVYISKGDLRLPKSDISDFLIPVSTDLEGTLLTSLMLFDGEGFGKIKLLYSNPQVKVYIIEQ